ncbi:MAG: O-methyltransferase [Acidimicrobiales bacterium]|nr:O-methyltransferase [Acidimicrobiales bacterium]
MSADRSIAIDPDISAYIQEHLNPPPDPIVARIHERTVDRFGDLAGMNIGEDQGRFLKMLVQMLQARQVVEVGTFTGMSALWLARGLREGGRLTCLELQDEPIEVARVGWQEAGVDDRIDVRIGPALESLQAMPADSTIDLAFVDADKEGYAAYVDEILPRLAPNGVLAIDNTLWSGRVADPDADDESTRALQALNDDLAGREDLDVVILSVGDGVTLVRHR